MNLKNIFLHATILVICFACGGAKKSDWQQQANGVWKYTIGEKSKINLLDAAGAVPNLARLDAGAATTFPLDKERIHITKSAHKIVIQLPLDDAEQIYGLGLQFKSVNRRGKTYHLKVDHYGGKDNGSTHAPVPFYLSSKGYGVLINSASYMTVYVGSSVRLDSKSKPAVYNRNTDKNWEAQPKSDVVEIVIPDGNAEIIVFNGETPLNTVRKYNLYQGGGVLPPKWGLGFTYRSHTRHTAEEVLAEVQEFEHNEFPLDFIGLEPGWMNMSYPSSYEWDEGRFPEPGKFVHTLLEQGVRTNLWMNPYIAPKAKLYEPMLPYAGTHLVWNGIVPDYTMDAARKIFLDFYTKNQLDIGVSGLKIDEVDGYDNWLWPDAATFPSGTSAEQMRQVYGLLMQKMVADLYHKSNQRTYGLVRASNAGAATLPFVLYNDYYDHRDFITALINSGFSGVLWTPEVRQSNKGEEWLRRMQSVCFSPMAMVNAWSSGTKPWSYPEVYEEVQQVAMLRMQLLPYIYSTFADYYFNGTPPVRPMQLVEGFGAKEEIKAGKLDDTANPYNLAIRKDIKDQFMFGDNLLVAPVFTGETSRTVILPQGKWYDFYTGEYAGENEVIEIRTALATIPLFVKDGGIIPMIGPRLHAPKPGEQLALQVRHYGKEGGSFLLYDDDGETFDYEKGDYSLTELSADPQVGSKGNEKRVEGSVFGYGSVTWKFMTE
ncbi:glycoside hydrolase family 31 protein [Imperialibacter roseus]|uniref:Glycoside hydrolase family 31 protein n=1 Tax=Imperialibacter roseus TaxID=1324217 RepID=A0ABZ0IHT1_9BACT|nr:TIM-barrel domain-containing protein [Imperialibacter roseus]WOK04573.1 glycoside hydrolase family 31 protein [Imperialibacter roseus]